MIAGGGSISLEGDSAAMTTGLEEAVACAVRALITKVVGASSQGGAIEVVVGPGAQVSVFGERSGLVEDVGGWISRSRGRSMDRAARDSVELGLLVADRIAWAHGGGLESCGPDARGLRLTFSPMAS